MLILNLGCGTKTSQRPDVVNIDWSIHLRLASNPVLRSVAPLVAGRDRRARLDALGSNIVVHDLSRGLPFPAESVDVVYHSHMLEHLDRSVAVTFLREARRVLRCGGIHRVVVPDLEALCRDYLEHLDLCDREPSEKAAHEGFVAAIIEQSVRREASGTSKQRPFRRFVENWALGDARRRGETHQWMYDRVTLGCILHEAGFVDSRVLTFDASDVPGWESYGLDLETKGGEYKPGSLYVEARKP